MYQAVTNWKNWLFNLLIGKLKLQSKGSLHSNTVIRTLDVAGCYILYSEEGPGPGQPRPLLTVPNVTAHPSTVSVPM